MDDEITNAINSLEGNTVNNDSQGINITASDNLSSSDMPPITRPEDVLAGLSDSASIEVPISSSQENTIPLKNDLEQLPNMPIDVSPMPSEIKDKEFENTAKTEPESLGQVYAPMPHMPGLQDDESLSQKIPASPNPAMVPDPLYGNQDNISTNNSLESLGINTTPIQVKKDIPQNTKKIIFYGIISIAVILLGVGGYFGFMSYMNNANAKILQGAAANLSAMPNMSSDIALDVNSYKLSGKLEVDTGKNLRMTLTEGDLPKTMIYMKKRDTLYLLNESLTTSTTKRFYQYNKASSIITDLTGIGVSPLSLFPQKSYITATTLSYFKRQSNEILNGKTMYKFVYTPDELGRKDILTKVIGNPNNYGYDISSSKLSVNIWIDKDSGNLSKIDANIEVAANTSGVAASRKLAIPAVTDTNSSYKINYIETFDYSYDENIKLPIGSKITSTEDAAIAFDNNFGTGATEKALDEESIITANSIKNALEQYKSDNGHYPTSTDITTLMTELTSGDNPYLGSDYNVSSINYTFDSKTNKYEISFRLNFQLSTGENITGKSPNKTYTLNN